MELNGKRIAILATHGFEQSELERPRDRLRKAGATVEIISLAPGEIRGWDKKDWGHPVKVDKTLEQASAGDYDAVVGYGFLELAQGSFKVRTRTPFAP